MNEKEFINELREIGINITSSQLIQLEEYYHLLVEWNEKINLTRIIEKKEVYLKHFYDSLTLSKGIDLNDNLLLCDIGTGAGFPGIVLKIVFPSLHVVLVDSLLKRVKFLEYVINKLDLKDIEVIHERAENFARTNREKFDIVTARAVANLKILLEFSIPILKISGHFVAMKGECEQEILEAEHILKELDAKINKIDKFLLPNENSKRSLVDIIKLGKTNSKYPRNFDKIKKNIEK